jgi:hypothetical protein
MSKRKPAKRTHKPGSPAAQYDFVNHCQRLVAARIKAGLYHDDPELEAAIADFDPAIALIEIAANPANEPGLRGATAAKLLPFWHREQSLMVKTADHAGTVINISIAAWAALPGSGAPKAIEAPAIDLTAHDSELTAHGRSSAPAPDVFNPAGIAERHAPGADPYVMERGADGIEHAVRVRHEQPRLDDGYEIVHDNATGTDIRIQRYRGVQNG